MWFTRKKQLKEEQTVIDIWYELQGSDLMGTDKMVPALFERAKAQGVTMSDLDISECIRKEIHRLNELIRTTPECYIRFEDGTAMPKEEEIALADEEDAMLYSLLDEYEAKQQALLGL